MSNQSQVKSSRAEPSQTARQVKHQQLIGSNEQALSKGENQISKLKNAGLRKVITIIIRRPHRFGDRELTNEKR